MSIPKEQFHVMIKGLGLPFVQEYRFHPVRMWRFDYYIPSLNIAFEYDGLGRGHTGITGVLRDTDKINEAQVLGISVYRVNTKTVNDGTAADLLRRVVEKHGAHVQVAGAQPRNRKVLNDNPPKRSSKVPAKRNGTGVQGPRVRNTRNGQ
jgi:hypothetical protein